MHNSEPGSQDESVNTLNITAAEGAAIHASLPILKSTYAVVRQLAELRLEAMGRHSSDFIAITDFNEYGVEVRHYCN